MRDHALVAATVSLLLSTSPPVQAQREHSLGLNLRVGSSPQVGVTWAIAPSVAVRPGLSAAWDKQRVERVDPITGNVASDVTTTTLGMDLDLLFALAAKSQFTSYLGVGGSAARRWRSGSHGTIWAARAFGGVRVGVLERLAIFGEVGIDYQDDRALERQRFSIGTSALGLIVFLK